MANTKDTPPKFKNILIILWFIFLCLWTFIFVNEYTLQTWKEVFLETRPVDPRDILRWDFVILSYSIEWDQKVRNFVNENINENKDRTWDTMYITLWTDNANLWYVSDVSFTKPSPDKLFITTKLESRISLWIWKYFVPEGTWREIERVRWNMKVLVKIDKYWTAKIVDLYYKWERIDPDNFEK